MHRIASTLLLGVLATGTAGGLVGCSNEKYSNANDAISLKTKINHDTVNVGETVTVMSWTENTLGRKAELKWTSTGGMLKTLDDGRTVQVTFDKAGTYSITGVLMADGVQVDKSDQVVTVNDLPTATKPAM